MILYHGSDIEVKNPKIIDSEKGRDFGPAFYLTPIKEQAERMAKRKQKINKSKQAFVSVFEWDEDKTNLKYKEYKKADEEWLEMIIKCRTDAKYKHNYDIVEGKIADDSVGTTISLVIEEQLTKEEAIKKLQFQKINSQIAFCNDECIKKLKFIKSYEVKK